MRRSTGRNLPATVKAVVSTGFAGVDTSSEDGGHAAVSRRTSCATSSAFTWEYPQKIVHRRVEAGCRGATHLPLQRGAVRAFSPARNQAVTGGMHRKCRTHAELVQSASAVISSIVVEAARRHEQNHIGFSTRQKWTVTVYRFQLRAALLVMVRNEDRLLSSFEKHFGDILTHQVETLHAIPVQFEQYDRLIFLQGFLCALNHFSFIAININFH